MPQTTHLSRRKFLKIAAGTLGAGVVVCGGSVYFGLRTPSSVLFPQSFCPYSGGSKVLVAYASKCGATAQVADRIASYLCSAGYQADLLPAGKVKDVSDYQAIVLGTAIYMGRVLAEAQRFTDRYLAAQSHVPLALFNVSLTMKEDTPENVQTAMDYMDPLVSRVRPDLMGFFAGRIDMDTLPPIYRLFAQSDSEGILAEGDFRDWPQIDAWAETLKKVI